MNKIFSTFNFRYQILLYHCEIYISQGSVVEDTTKMCTESIPKTRRINILSNKRCECCRCLSGKIIHLLWSSVSLIGKSNSWMTGHIRSLKTLMLWIKSLIYSQWQVACTLVTSFLIITERYVIIVLPLLALSIFPHKEHIKYSDRVKIIF